MPHELAERWKCTDQCIRNYINGKYGGARMPVAHKDERGWSWLDPAACEAWRRVHRPGLVANVGARSDGWGGKRERAGRRRKHRSRTPSVFTAGGEVGNAPDVHDQAGSLPLARGLGGGAGGGAPASANQADDEEPSKPVRMENLHPKDIAAIRLSDERAETLRLQREKELGNLVDKAETSAAVRGAWEQTREALERQATRLAPVLVSKLGLDPEARAIIEMTIGADVTELLEELRARVGEIAGEQGNGGGENAAAGG